MHRYHYKYHPEDDNAYMWKISPLLLPKRKVKISATKLSVPDEESTTLLRKKREKGAHNRNTIAKKRAPCKKQGSTVATAAFAVQRLLHAVCNTTEDIHKVHQQPPKLLIDLNVLLSADNMCPEALPPSIETLLSIPEEGCFI